MSSCLFTSVVRPAQYRSTRSAGSSRLSAEQYSSTSPDPTARPAARNSPAKLTSRPVKSGGASGAAGTGDDLGQVVADDLEVVAVLDYRAQRVRRVRHVQVRLAEHVETPGPVDGLGDAGRLGQVELAQPLDGGDHLARQRGGHARLPDQHDLDLAVGWRIADPVVQAAPLQ